ncbi:DUF3332 domain-containing protein [Flavimarina sp. Hel_I_48]|uniref:DUF3332 domain-containing protein n=1 Tax=Flavimarina sp. Hel_I_48 TaxID=1392488 RepID=UPI0004DF3BF9|nr:DUF3332 domain-containing protein [Flavimarina sp. Hel_I_48]
MKKLSIVGMLCLAFLFNSCLGSYSAFNNLREWNEDATNNKFVNNLIFWGLNIIPVYGLFFAGDTLIFNVIEFWSGDNPVAMNEGESQTEVLAYKGNTYKMTATKNKFDITVIDGEKQGNTISLVYKPEDQSWNTEKDGELIKLSSFKDGLMLVYLPNGETVKINPAESREESLAQINEAVHNFKFEQRTLVVGN